MIALPNLGAGTVVLQNRSVAVVKIYLKAVNRSEDGAALLFLVQFIVEFFISIYVAVEPNNDFVDTIVVLITFFGLLINYLQPSIIAIVRIQSERISHLA